MKLDEYYSVDYDGTQWILSYEKTIWKKLIIKQVKKRLVKNNGIITV